MIFWTLLLQTVILHSHCHFLSRVKNPNVYFPREDLSFLPEIPDHDVEVSSREKRITPSGDTDDSDDDYDVDKDPDPVEDSGAEKQEGTESIVYKPTGPTSAASRTTEQDYYDYTGDPGWPTITIKLVPTTTASTVISTSPDPPPGTRTTSYWWPWVQKYMDRTLYTTTSTASSNTSMSTSMSMTMSTSAPVRVGSRTTSYWWPWVQKYMNRTLYTTTSTASSNTSMSMSMTMSTSAPVREGSSAKRRLFYDVFKGLVGRKNTLLVNHTRWDSSRPVEPYTGIVKPGYETAFDIDHGVIYTHPETYFLSDFTTVFITEVASPLTRTIPRSVYLPDSFAWRTVTWTNPDSAITIEPDMSAPPGNSHYLITAPPNLPDALDNFFGKANIRALPTAPKPGDGGGRIYVNPSNADDASNWKCHTCGLNETEFGSPLCYRIFERRDQRHSFRKRRFGKACSGDKSYVGGCFVRYLDVGEEYNERGCRNWPPLRGKSYASKRFMKLEKLLRYQQEGCVASPHAVLVPFSNAVHLYARFHVCVCRGSYCNTAMPSKRFQCTEFVFSMSVLLLLCVFQT